VDDVKNGAESILISKESMKTVFLYKKRCLKFYQKDILTKFIGNLLV